ncbi:hypothetical protein AB0M87_33255 [Streptomyces sp. NPDC051320]|uniref:hypothetical protein n=1 Tax=Streptomyces sp. NPDC051320 TaxID=3154644 RepID=UPI003443CDBD
MPVEELDLYARTVAEGFEASHKMFQVLAVPSMAKVDGITFTPSDPRTPNNMTTPCRVIGWDKRKDRYVTPTEPIYNQLVRERGDVVADARRSAETAWREVLQAIDRFRGDPYLHQ